MTDNICQLRESSHTYLYISLSMSTNVWSSLACETMCGRGHEYYVRGNPFVCFCTCTVRGLASSHVPNHMTGGWSSEVLFKLQKKKLMSSSKSYLYGRPVTEWSTPPPLSSKAQTTLLHKEAPGILPNFVYVKLISFTAIPSSKAMIPVVPVKVVELNHFL